MLAGLLLRSQWIGINWYQSFNVQISWYQWTHFSVQWVSFYVIHRLFCSHLLSRFYWGNRFENNFSLGYFATEILFLNIVSRFSYSNYYTEMYEKWNTTIKEVFESAFHGLLKISLKPMHVHPKDVKISVRQFDKIQRLGSK